MSYRRHISGSGILEKTLYKIPYEFHIPGYQFCGPNTKLEKPLRRGDGLDLACKNHDIAYSQNKDLKLRHDADRVLAERALQRFHSKNASLGEKAAALGVVGAIKAKIKFGMGISTRKVCCVKVLNECEKSLEKTKTTIEDYLKKISEFKTNDASEKKYRRKQQNKPPVNRKRMRTDDDDDDVADGDIITKTLKIT
jgi:hypothetical protein